MPGRPLVVRAIRFCEMPQYTRNGESQATSNLAQIGARMPTVREEILAKKYRWAVLFGCLQAGCLPVPD